MPETFSLVFSCAACPLVCVARRQEAEREKARLVEVAEESKRRLKAEEKAALMARKAAEHKERLEAERAGSVARDAQIRQRQREARRRRVYMDRVRVKSEFDALWEVKFAEMVDSKMEAAKHWLATESEAAFKVQKELHILKRKFFASPAPETADLERALSDPSNAIFAHMANLLYKENKTLHTFFHQFDKEVRGSRLAPPPTPIDPGVGAGRGGHARSNSRKISLGSRGR